MSKKQTVEYNQISDPISNNLSTDHVSDQVKLLLAVLHVSEQSLPSLMQFLRFRHVPSFRTNYLLPALESGLIEMTQPDSPRSPTQKYRLTAKGLAVLKNK